MRVTNRFLLYVSIACVVADAFEPFTTTVVVGLGVTLGRIIYSYSQESCDSKWVAFNATGELVHGVGLELALPVLCSLQWLLFRCSSHEEEL